MSADQDEIEFTLNGEQFTVSLTDSGWGWTHWGRDSVIDDSGSRFFATACAAQQDAMRYMREAEADSEERRRQEREDFKYGTYDEQVRQTHRAYIGLK